MSPIEVLVDREVLQDVLVVVQVNPFQLGGLYPREQACLTKPGQEHVRPSALTLVALPGRFKRGQRWAIVMQEVKEEGRVQIARSFDA